MSKTSLSDIHFFMNLKNLDRVMKTFYFYPAMCDFELAVRKGDWNLLLSGVYRCILAFFSTGMTHYKTFATLFQQELLNLQRKFPVFSDILRRVTLLPR